MILFWISDIDTDNVRRNYTLIMKENRAGILVNLSFRIVFSIDSVLFVSIFVPLTEVFRCTRSNLLRWRLHHRHQLLLRLPASLLK